MGISDKLQVEGGLEPPESHKWVIAGVSLRAPLRPIKTTTTTNKSSSSSSALLGKQNVLADGADDDDEEGNCSPTTTTTTPTCARIPESLPCPPAPRKRRPSSSSSSSSSSSKCRFNGTREFFFVPPDLDSVFIRRLERAK